MFPEGGPSQSGPFRRRMISFTERGERVTKPVFLHGYPPPPVSCKGNNIVDESKR